MDNQHFDPSIEALLSLGRAIDEARGEVVTAIALALADYGRSVETSALSDEERGERRSGWSDKSLTMRRRPW
ncbi:hypothetical protein [Porphyromonas sp. HMSC065F10]|uniref:hypothetical protein n=1 Tax=Porphyromonas sp. HMSC065F10 TaxID=1739394 RepID=UPI0008A321BA|nr:hypothetical protein [Porphyromonas sp. HMSC065F10]OFR34949.1 hypothetical protein HMPREF2890_05695 [Porphyromonas sp. HMSC065F10]